MKAHELFGLALRLLGVYLLVVEVPDFVQGLFRIRHVGFPFLIWSLIGIAFGFWFLRGARAVQELAYPGRYVAGD
jgi:hypothetical protein